jgi:hypothetical protein
VSCTIENARKLLAERLPGCEGAWAAALWPLGGGVPEIVLVEGDLHVATDDDWKPRGGTVTIVNGSLIVSAGVRVFRDDCLIVCDSLHCLTAVIGGECMVGGNLNATHWVYANSSNDYGITVHGDVRTILFVEEGMVSYATKFDCEVWCSMNTVEQDTPPLQYPRREHALWTRNAALKAGLHVDAIDKLSDYVSFCD